MSQTSESPIPFWVIEDHRIYREALVESLTADDTVDCTGSFSRVETAMRNLARDNPSVVLLDLGLPGIDGVDAIPVLKEGIPSVRILVLTQYNDPERILDAISSGADGYLLKNREPESIANAIRETARGIAPVDHEVTAALGQALRSNAGRTRRTPVVNPLTSRERDVLRELCQGATKKEAAANLGVSYHTIDSHVRNLYQKLEVRSVNAAVAIALRDSLV